jgi:hypothetical protein
MRIDLRSWSLAVLTCLLCSNCRKIEAGKEIANVSMIRPRSDSFIVLSEEEKSKGLRPLDTVLYNKLLMYLVHERPNARWPAKAPYPQPGAVLPFRRVVAFYGNFYSEGMGVLGALPEGQMLRKLQDEVVKWQKADPRIPVVPALHYVAVTAQRSPGIDAKYRLRMPASQIEKAIRLADSINALVFLDVQVGHSTLQEELPHLEPYLSRENVHLGIDPEYSMKGGEVPCSTIGTFDATDVNYASQYLAELITKYKTAPKVLVVHRFTKQMVTNYRNIRTRPEVQIVMDMDGFGFPAKKIDSYKSAIANEPVQFTGFKLFYKNDVLTPGYKRLMQPMEVLELYPSPIYIQYQ